ncbi:hypothetical protein CR513_18771, partial [Mucuna pruriens]
MEDNTNRMFKEGTSLSNHLNEFQGIIDQMSGRGIKFEDKILELLLLNSLLESWETFKDNVLNEEMRRKTQGSSSQSEVLVTENKGRSQKKKREKSRKKREQRKKGMSKEKDDDDDDRVTTTIVDDLVILRDSELVNIVSDESMLIIDSGATLHVTPRKEFFRSYTSGDFGVLKMGNDGVTR